MRDEGAPRRGSEEPGVEKPRYRLPQPMSSFPLPRKELARLLLHWPVGRLMFTRTRAGTANPAILVVTTRGQYFLKHRHPRYSDHGQLIFDHAVLRHLARAGLPVIPPVKTVTGDRWLQADDAVYELYPLIEGQPHQPGNLAQIAAARELLACFHEATAEFSPPGHKPWPRYFAPADRLPEIVAARDLLRRGMDTGGLPVAEAERVLDYLETQTRAVEARVPEVRYWDLPQVIVHGDFHHGNIQFYDVKIAGLFDFDWVSRQPRLVDLADGLIFFGAERAAPFNPADLYSLTQAFTLRPDWVRVFLEPYLARHELTGEERACLGDLIRARWLYMRLEQMQRKLPEQERLAFLLREVTVPLQWLDEYEPLLL